MMLQTLLNDFLLMEIQLKNLIHRLSVLESLVLLLSVPMSPVIQNLDLKFQVEL